MIEPTEVKFCVSTRFLGLNGDLRSIASEHVAYDKLVTVGAFPKCIKGDKRKKVSRTSTDPRFRFRPFTRQVRHSETPPALESKQELENSVRVKKCRVGKLMIRLDLCGCRVDGGVV